MFFRLCSPRCSVAARLETLCEPGGLCVSRAVEEQVKDKLPYPFEDLGEQSLKNIARPLRVYVLTPAAIAELPEPAAAVESRPANTTQLRVAAGTRLNDAFAIDRLIGSGLGDRRGDTAPRPDGDRIEPALGRLRAVAADAVRGLAVASATRSGARNEVSFPETASSPK